MASEVTIAKGNGSSANTQNAEGRSRRAAYSIPTKLSALKMPSNTRSGMSRISYKGHDVEVVEANDAFSLYMRSPYGEEGHRTFTYASRPKDFVWKQLKNFVKRTAT